MNPFSAFLTFAALAAWPAQAFFIHVSDPVSEYYAAGSDRYRLVAGQLQDPEWARTGYGFTAAGFSISTCGVGGADCPRPVREFYAPSAKAWFYSADPGEVAVLQRPGSGWEDRGVRFRLPLPDVAGQCAAGRAPVIRFYNGGGGATASHRFVLTEAARQRMRAAGWQEEGPVFCAYGREDSALATRSLGMATLPAPDRACGPCLEGRNVPVPGIRAAEKLPGDSPWLPFDRTGASTSPYGLVPGNIFQAAQRSFLQFEYPVVEYQTQTRYGIYLDGRDRVQGGIAALGPVARLPLGGSELPLSGPLAPFRLAYDTEVELRLSFRAFVKSVTTAGPGHHAYALPVIEFRDATSDLRVLLAIQAFGTVPPADGLGREQASGHVLVATTFRRAPPFGRSLALDFLATPPPFVSANPWGYGGDFDFRLSRADFVQLLGIARTIEPRLSTDPQHYQVASFEFRVETSGDATIGLNVQEPRLELLRR